MTASVLPQSPWTASWVVLSVNRREAHRRQQARGRVRSTAWSLCLGFLRNSDRTWEGEDSGKCQIHHLFLACFSPLWQTLDRPIGGKRASCGLEFRGYNPSLGRMGCRSGLIYGANHETERQDASVQLLFSFPRSDEFRIHTCWVGWCRPHSEWSFLSHYVSSKAVPH